MKKGRKLRTNTPHLDSTNKHKTPRCPALRTGMVGSKIPHTPKCPIYSHIYNASRLTLYM